MSFRRRNVLVSASSGSPVSSRSEVTTAFGSRPSPFDGRLTTSSGTSSLDQLVAGHSGLPLGTSILIEESGTTDFGGILLKYFAAEGLVQGHDVHALGFSESWRRELPGLATGVSSTSSSSQPSTTSDERMKIAWRYETLGNRPAPNREDPRTPPLADSQASITYCHSFDISKRLETSVIKGSFHATPIKEGLSGFDSSIFRQFIDKTTLSISASKPNVIHRIIIPGLLSPSIYGSSASQPEHVLQFLHSIRAVIRKFPRQVTVMTTLPISLFPRSSGLVRWAEMLSDGVLELIPLEQQKQLSAEPGQEDKSQGLLRCHSLPIFHEKGGGLKGSWTREDLAFRLSGSNGLVITPFYLPPVGEHEAETKERSSTTSSSQKALDF